MGLIPAELRKTYKYDCAVIVVLPDGTFKEEEVRGKSDRNDHHKGAIVNIIDDLCRIEDNSYLYALYNDLVGVSNSFKAAQLCTGYDVFTIIIVEQICDLFCPDVISIEQFQIIQTFLNENSNYFKYELYHSGEISRKFNDQENDEDTLLSVDEVLELINTSNWVSKGSHSYR